MYIGCVQMPGGGDVRLVVLCVHLHVHVDGAREHVLGLGGVEGLVS